MACRFAMQGMKILSGAHFDADRNQLGLRDNANRCSIVVVYQSVEKSDHDYVMMAHDDCFMNSRMVIPSPDPLRETPKRILNSPTGFGSFDRAGLVKRIQ
jgi:hypothetical protein